MKRIVRNKVTVDDIAFYLARRVELIPDLYGVFLEDLADLERSGKVSLVPITILQRYHYKLKRAS